MMIPAGRLPLATATLLVAFFVTWLCGVFAPSCSAASPQPSQPNVLLIVTDDQRPDTIAALGNDIIRTPHLDQLVRQGTTFLNATCANPICTPSRAELLTGCTGFRSGVFDFGGRIDDSVPRLPEPFHRAGYQTWYTGKWHNNGRPADHGYRNIHGVFTGGGGKWARPQFDYRGHPVTGYRGWLFRDADYQPLPQNGVGLSPATSEQIADAAIEVIQRASSPFLLHVNFTAPHDPLMPRPQLAASYDADRIPLPENFLPEHPFDHGNQGGRDEQLLPVPRTAALVRSDLAAYYAVITDLDAQVGRILDSLRKRGVAENTIVVFTSDHGLAMGSHGLRGKQNMYEHTIRVPLVFAGPGIPAGTRRHGLAYLRDLFPTLCELTGIEIPDLDGRSQVPVIRGETESVYPAVYGYFRDSQRMIRTDRWKLIRYPQVDRVQLFDLQSDPSERHNLAGHGEHSERVQRLSTQLDDWLARHQTP